MSGKGLERKNKRDFEGISGGEKKGIR